MAVTIPKFSIKANVMPVVEDSIQSLSDDKSEKQKNKCVANIYSSKVKKEKSKRSKSKIDFDLDS